MRIRLRVLGVTVASFTFDGERPSTELPKPSMTASGAHNFDRPGSDLDEAVVRFGFQ